MDQTTDHESNENTFYFFIVPIALLLLLLTQGPFSAILLVGLAFLLSSLPEFRSIVDATLGHSPPPQDRLRLCFPSLANRDESVDQPSKLNSISPTDHALDLSQVPPELVAAFLPLIESAMRDYVESWYMLPTISTGDKTFLNHLHASFQHMLVKAYVKVSSKSSKETLIYLMGCLSMNLVRLIHNPPQKQLSSSATAARKSQRTLQVRRISEEILLTLAPPSITVSPIVLSLLSELLSVQLITTVDGLDDDWFNQTIISFLGTTAAATTSVPVAQLESVPSLAPQQSSVTLPSPTADSMAPSDEDGPLTGHQVLSLYLKSSSDILYSSTSGRLPSSIVHLINTVPVWTPSHPPLSPPHLENYTSPKITGLVRIWTQLDGFRKMSQMTELKQGRDLLKSDALSLLSSLAASFYQAIPPEEDSWRKIVVETLRRLEAPQINGAELFGNLQDWLLERIHNIECIPLTPKPGSVAKDVEDRVCFMAMPFVPPSHNDDRISGSADQRRSFFFENDGRQHGFGGSVSPVRFLSGSRLERAAFPDSRSAPVDYPEEEGDMTEGYVCDEPEEEDELETDPANAPEDIHEPTESGPTFTVSITDISLPTAFDNRGLIKQKRDLEFLIAVEVTLLPGFIVTRKWSELERMEAGLGKLKLAGLGTTSFPRALLPSHLNLKTIDHVVRELEGYLATLLNDERYAKSQPVLTFFEKERSGSAVKNPLGSLVSTWDSIGKGVVSVGKEVTKPVNLATQGFSQLSKGVLAGLPFGVKEGASGGEEGTLTRNPVEGEARSSKSAEQSKTRANAIQRTSLQDRLASFSFSSSSTFSESPAPEGTGSEPASTELSTSPIAAESSTQPPPSTLSVSDSTGSMDEPEAPSPVATLRAVSELNQASPDVAPTPTPPTLTDPRTSMSTGNIVSEGADEKREIKAVSDRDRVRVRAEANNLESSTQVIRDRVGTEKLELDAADFEAIVIALMSVLEAAYGLEDSEPSWSVRRGMLRVLETVLRTTSLSAQLKGAVIGILDQVREPARIAEWVNHASVTAKEICDQSVKAREERRVLARRLWVASWAGLKIGLGSNATEVAAGKVFDVFQGPEGPVVILHSLLMDFIRIVLLL
ncbi:hypothetical protein CROQUDRAFT_95469 [Cronartium quercuum f. sp. fusiforme G11]|uniref:PXA domain-containing protein n=1 Tax=Cronartium quercuum f. sp. fusiforme G11 TaxID=708437 RepID=A0A9P6NHD7_9BASI|nr:hypothetical protein CROQUDRAFT_95469 [Cronartium quercuum f. sp. fusiforme G11]